MIILSKDNSKMFFTESILSIEKQDESGGENPFLILAVTTAGTSELAGYSKAEQRDVSFDALVEACTHSLAKYQCLSDVEANVKIHAREYAR